MCIAPRAYHGCVVLNLRIFVIGGFDGMEHFNSVKCFDPLTKSWSEISPMNHRRYDMYITHHTSGTILISAYSGCCGVVVEPLTFQGSGREI